MFGLCCLRSQRSTGKTMILRGMASKGDHDHDHDHAHDDHDHNHNHDHNHDDHDCDDDHDGQACIIHYFDE